jgi:hypothetical protein
VSWLLPRASLYSVRNVLLLKAKNHLSTIESVSWPSWFPGLESCNASAGPISDMFILERKRVAPPSGERLNASKMWNELSGTEKREDLRSSSSRLIV